MFLARATIFIIKAPANYSQKAFKIEAFTFTVRAKKCYSSRPRVRVLAHEKKKMRRGDESPGCAKPTTSTRSTSLSHVPLLILLQLVYPPLPPSFSLSSFSFYNRRYYVDLLQFPPSGLLQSQIRWLWAFCGG